MLKCKSEKLTMFKQQQVCNYIVKKSIFWSYGKK